MFVGSSDPERTYCNRLARPSATSLGTSGTPSVAANGELLPGRPTSVGPKALNTPSGMLNLLMRRVGSKLMSDAFNRTSKYHNFLYVLHQILPTCASSSPEPWPGVAMATRAQDRCLCLPDRLLVTVFNTVELRVVDHGRKSSKSKSSASKLLHDPHCHRLWVVLQLCDVQVARLLTCQLLFAK